MTGVWARALTRDALLDAFKAHRTVATSGGRIALAFWVGDAFMGDEVACSGPPRLRGWIRGERPLGAVEVVRDGEVAARWEAPQAEFALDWLDEAVGTGRHFYYVRVVPEQPTPHFPSSVVVAFGGQAWSSPIWVNVRS